MKSLYRDSVGIRTQDPQLRRLLLYPAELRSRHNKTLYEWKAHSELCCRGDPTRTGDRLVPNQERYQLRYTPETAAKVAIFLFSTKIFLIFLIPWLIYSAKEPFLGDFIVSAKRAVRLIWLSVSCLFCLFVC